MPHAYVEQQISDDCQENACGQRERSYSVTLVEHGSAPYEFHLKESPRTCCGSKNVVVGTFSEMSVT